MLELMDSFSLRRRRLQWDSHVTNGGQLYGPFAFHNPGRIAWECWIDCRRPRYYFASELFRLISSDLDIRLPPPPWLTVSTSLPQTKVLLLLSQPISSLCLVLTTSCYVFFLLEKSPPMSGTFRMCRFQRVLASFHEFFAAIYFRFFFSLQ